MLHVVHDSVKINRVHSVGARPPAHARVPEWQRARDAKARNKGPIHVERSCLTYCQTPDRVQWQNRSRSVLNLVVPAKVNRAVPATAQLSRSLRSAIEPAMALLWPCYQAVNGSVTTLLSLLLENSYESGICQVNFNDPC